MTTQYTDDELDSPAVEHSDAELITAVRGGDDSAFGVLWSRHEAAARRLASQIGNPSNADDLVSESFFRVLRALKAGSGPDGAFRPYLFSTLRRINIDNGRSYYTRIALTDDERELDLDSSDSAADVLFDNAESSAAWRAWNSLPDSTKTLLWHLIIEEETPAQIAPLIGTTPNGVSSRAVRAKERLRQAFLQQHLLDADNEPCRQARRRFGEYVRDALSTRDQTEVRAHLDTCAGCQAALFDVSDINQTMKLVIGPAVLGGAVIAGHYAAAGGLIAAGKGSIFAHVTHVGHLLKNPFVATATAVTVVAAATASAFGINAINSGDTKPVSAAVAPITTSSSSSAPAVAPIATPSSITPTLTPSVTPTPPPSVTPTPAPTPTVKRTTPTVKKTTPKPVVPVVPITTPATTPVTTPATSPVVVVPPPPPPYDTVTVAATPSPSQSSGLARIVFSVNSDWNIVSITAPSNFICPTLGMNTSYGATATCYGHAIAAGDLAFSVGVQATTRPAKTGDSLTWRYTDDNTDDPPSAPPNGSANIVP